jgi:hypothetical protein
MNDLLLVLNKDQSHVHTVRCESGLRRLHMALMMRVLSKFVGPRCFCVYKSYTQGMSR